MYIFIDISYIYWRCEDVVKTLRSLGQHAMPSQPSFFAAVFATLYTQPYSQASSSRERRPSSWRWALRRGQFNWLDKHV